MKTCKFCSQEFNSTIHNKIFCCRRCKERYYNKEQYRQQKIKLLRRSKINNKCRICEKDCNNLEGADPLCKLCYAYVFHMKEKMLPTDTKSVLDHKKYHSTRERRFIDKDGYVIIKKENHPNSKSYGRIREHVYIMSEYLGRSIKDKETVHHKNGIKDDNRIENLELWSHSHPYGQRIEDKLLWAKQFLGEYGYKVTGEHSSLEGN